MRTTIHATARGAGRAARRAALPALMLLAAGCDSMPDALGPTARDLLSTFAIWNDTPAPMTQALMHPTRFGTCTEQDDAALPGGVYEFTSRTREGREFHVPAGCYVFFVRFDGQPGHVQVAAVLGDDDYESTRIPALPPVPEALPDGATLRIDNLEPGHTGTITRVYLDPCVTHNNRYYGFGDEGGATRDLPVNVPHGESLTLSVPPTCHLVTVLWDDGAYRFSTYRMSAGAQAALDRPTLRAEHH